MYAGESFALTDIVNVLTLKGYNTKNCAFSFFWNKENLFVYCGMKNGDTITESVPLPIAEVGTRLQLKVKSITAAQQVASKQLEMSSQNQKPADKKDHGKRNKERKIGEIIEKVSEWRIWYAGKQENGEIVKLSLEKAAKKVGVAKKTLDDYLLQLRAGKRYEFDFHTNQDSKVGVLRSYVKKHRRTEREGVKEENNISGGKNYSSLTYRGQYSRLWGCANLSN